MREHVQRVIWQYRNGGLKTIAAKVVNRFARMVADSDSFLVWERELGNGAKKVAPPEAIEVRIATTADLPKFQRVDGLDNEKLQTLRRRFQQNATCFMISEGDHVIGFIWLTDDPGLIAEEFGAMLLHVSIKKNEAYMYDLYLAPDKRGQALSIALMDALLKESQRRGYVKLYCLTRATYLPANWTMRLISCKRVGRVHLKRSFGRTHIEKYEIFS